MADRSYKLRHRLGDLRAKVLWARVRRFVHIMKRERFVDCGTYDFIMCTPKYRFIPRMMLVACRCGKVFYQDSEYEEVEEKWKKMNW